MYLTINWCTMYSEKLISPSHIKTLQHNILSNAPFPRANMTMVNAKKIPMPF